MRGRREYLVKVGARNQPMNPLRGLAFIAWLQVLDPVVSVIRGRVRRVCTLVLARSLRLTSAGRNPEQKHQQGERMKPPAGTQCPKYAVSTPEALSQHDNPVIKCGA